MFAYRQVFLNNVLSTLQLHALGFISQPKLDPESGVAGTLMDMYQDMGDVLALQYGGSAAHNMVRLPSGSNPPQNPLKMTIRCFVSYRVVFDYVLEELRRA